MAVEQAPGWSLTGMLYLVRYRVLMATVEPHRKHSSMSPATWQLRQGKQKAPHRPGGQRDVGLAEGCKRKGGKASQELWLLT